MSKNSTGNSTKKETLYLSILSKLNHTTNLEKIRKDLNISKQQLNYYLRGLKKKGQIVHKGRGWYEPIKTSKNSTKYGILLEKDISRGHAYVWTIKIKKPNKWNKRIEILNNKGINFKLVGALKTTPRIKALGRKVWLCNNHLRIYDKKEKSYYGKTAKESRYLALNEVKLILGVLERKLGISLNPTDIEFQKEHYALIKNDLAISENRKGNIWRIRDENGEWLLVDDSLEKGGELETIGKKAFHTNIPMQKWWNDHKENDFKVTPTFLMEQLNVLVQDRRYWAEHQKSHVEAIQTLSQTVKELREEIKRLRK